MPPMTGQEAFRCLLQLFAGPSAPDILAGVGPLLNFLGSNNERMRQYVSGWASGHALPPRVMLWGLAEAAMHMAFSDPVYTEHALEIADTLRHCARCNLRWRALDEVRHEPNL